MSWGSERRGIIGASDIAVAESKMYGGIYKVVASKLGLLDGVETIDPKLSERGHNWEATVSDGVHAHTNYLVAGEQAQYVHETNERWTCTVDGILLPGEGDSIEESPGGLEIKTIGVGAPWAWEYWIPQVQWSMLVTGLPRWLLAVAKIEELYDQTDGRYREQLTGVTYRWMTSDSEIQDRLIETAGRIATHVDAGTLPEPDTGTALPAVCAVNMMPTDDGTLYSIDNMTAAIARRGALKAAAKAANAELSLIDAKLRQRMGPPVDATKPTELFTEDGVWRVRVGAPVRKMTLSAERKFIDAYCVHLPDCPPGCEDHRPDLLIARLDTDAAKEVFEPEYEDLKEPTADRRLTIKQMETYHD